ncbi:hypothetical protein Fcan01_28343 [Folsomia candida]|uniref:Uncharacterized protein n=1 Tax=Folsomia candida TaxID=158441 RepID=A0A226CVF9_FOLCA|nr:hypothetical protein Fcan01_28343 [Folsomia candida]
MIVMNKVAPIECSLVPFLMWQLLHTYCYMFNQFSHLPYDFSLRRKTLIVKKDSIKGKIISTSSFTWLFAQSMTCGCFLSWKLFTKSNYRITNQDMEMIEKLRIFANIYYAILTVAMTGMSATIAFHPNVIATIVNRIVKFEDKLKVNWNAKATTRRSPMWIQNVLIFLLRGTIIPAILIGPGLAIINMHPLNIWLKSDYIMLNLILKPITICLSYCLSIELTKSALAFLIMGLIVMKSVSKGATILREMFKFKILRGRMIIPLSEIRIYREFQIWNQQINAAFGYRSVPPLVFCGVCITTCSLYGTIRMYVSLPIFVYPLLPLTTMLSVIFQFTLLPQAAEGFEKSVDFIAFVRRKCNVNYFRKVARSLRPLGLRCGPFGIISNTWTVRIWSTVSDFTVTLLLTL